MNPITKLANDFMASLKKVSGPEEHTKADELEFERLLLAMNEIGQALPLPGDERHWRERFGIPPAPDAILVMDETTARQMAEAEDWAQDTLPEEAHTTGALVLRDAFTMFFLKHFRKYGRHN